MRDAHLNQRATIVILGMVMLKRGLKISLISIVAIAIAVPLTALAFVALALIGY